MKNRFCEMLGIRYPIIQGGMAWSSDGTLAAAVSNAGGAGIIGTGGRTTEWVEKKNKIIKTTKPQSVKQSQHEEDNRGSHRTDNTYKQKCRKNEKDDSQHDQGKDDPCQQSAAHAIHLKSG